MGLHLPKPIELYFAAGNAGNADGLAACFTGEGTVLDEGRTLAGHEAIKAWSRAAKAKYSHIVEPLEVGADAERVIVKGRVSGNFSGSPVVLSFGFRLMDDKIAHLEIG
jgi:choline dehydrogenase-like flavoprotein